jgi:endonuclease/exonuclease/phosphatase (EEP) superfamily protein YafD
MTSWLKMLIAACIVLGVVLTALGRLARWWPMFDLFNNGLLAVAVGAVGLLCLALFARDGRLILPAALLAALNVGLIVVSLQGAASEAAPGGERFLRVVTSNLRFRSDSIDGVAGFLTDTNADVVVLQEATRPHLIELAKV